MNKKIVILATYNILVGALAIGGFIYTGSLWCFLLLLLVSSGITEKNRDAPPEPPK